MSLTMRAGLLAGAAALTLTGVGFASTATDATTDDLRAQVEKLQQRIAELESRQGDNWLTEKRAAEVRSLVHDVLADADTRASLLSSGMTAGYDGGFTIGDTAGNFLLRINGQLQTRFVYSHQRRPTADPFDFDLEDLLGVDPEELDPDELDDLLEALGFDDLDALLEAFLADVADLEDLLEDLDDLPAAVGMAFPNLIMGSDFDRHRSGFENTRTKLWFTGHVVNPNWQYVIEGDFGRGVGGEFTLLDAYIAHDYGNGFKMVMGQFRLPFLGETLVDARYLQAVERSLVNSYFTAGLSQGILGVFETDMFRLTGTFSDGMHMANTGWHLGPDAGSTEYAFTFRGDVLLGGTWDQFHEFRSEPGEPFGLRAGAAVHVQDGEYGTTFDHETFIIAATVDASVKFGGANIYAAGVYRNIDVQMGGNFVQWGALVQGGFHIMPEWEIFGRYEFADLDLPDLTVLGQSVYSFDDLHIITVGVNHYMFGAGHQAKWTTDFGYAFNRVELADLRTGWRSDFGGKRGQILLRTQLQLAF